MAEPKLIGGNSCRKLGHIEIAGRGIALDYGVATTATSEYIIQPLSL